MGDRSSPEQAGATLRFGAFEFDRTQGVLYERGRPVRLQEMPLRVLALLVAHPGEVIPHDLFYERLWPDDELGVLEDNLYTAIGKLRRALRDSAQHPQFIETVPRKGYRFVAPVVEADDTARTPRATGGSTGRRRRWSWAIAVSGLIAVAAAAWWLNRPEAEPMPDTPVLAVLPFENLVEDADQAYFSQGLTDEMIATFSRIGGLEVLSRTSAFAARDRGMGAREISEQLGVTALLEGSVRKQGDRVRIAARLVDTRSGVQLWSQTFERELTDVFAMQEEIALDIAEALRTRLTDVEAERLAQVPTSDPDAYQHYLKGRYFWNRRTAEDMQRAIDHFERALEADPEYAQAHVALASVYGPMAEIGYIHPQRARQRMTPHLERAMRLDSDLAGAHLAQGLSRMAFEWDWEGAERAYRRAIMQDPDAVWARTLYSYMLIGAGRLEAAREQLRVVARLDPLSPIANSNLAAFHVRQGDFARAREVLDEALDAHPDFWMLWSLKGRIHEIQGRLEPARESMRRARSLAVSSPRPKADLARIESRLGNTVRARALLASLEREADETGIYFPNVATVHAALGDMDAAFEWLERSVAQRHPRLIVLASDPAFDAMHEDPRFEQLIERIGLASRS